ncbi:hypothetical protein [Kosakonia sacchari]|uniref:hypothetical protein n=1 Tax=Kosakonia sacchari TaxID=1158459 RepID=UPI000807496B|nr:hypothetical protein [Kosakonia sacchari]
MTAQLRDIIQSEVCDFFAGFVEIHTELGGPNSIEEAQDLLSDRLYAALAGMDSDPVVSLGLLSVQKARPLKLSREMTETDDCDGCQHYRADICHGGKCAAPPAPVAVPDVFVIPEPATLTNINQLCPLDVNLSQTDFATGWNECRQFALANNAMPPVVKGISAYCQGWNACRAAMQAEPVTAATWIAEAKKMAEMYGTSFVVFRNGEEPQCADPRKVVISFTDEGLGYPAAPITAATVPDGWKLVPVIAFPSQWAAGQKAFQSAGINKIDAVYKAMVAAAPEQEV